MRVERRHGPNASLYGTVSGTSRRYRFRRSTRATRGASGGCSGSTGLPVRDSAQSELFFASVQPVAPPHRSRGTEHEGDPRHRVRRTRTTAAARRRAARARTRRGAGQARLRRRELHRHLHAQRQLRQVGHLQDAAADDHRHGGRRHGGRAGARGDRPRRRRARRLLPCAGKLRGVRGGACVAARAHPRRHRRPGRHHADAAGLHGALPDALGVSARAGAQLPGARGRGRRRATADPARQAPGRPGHRHGRRPRQGGDRESARRRPRRCSIATWTSARR